MKLPERIPKPLRDSALILAEFGEGEAAWSGNDAIAAIESLKGSTVFISDVVLLEALPWVGLVESERELSIDRRTGEPDADYAQRSRASAAEFIRGCATASDDAVFKLTFRMWKDAA
jgi:hypothetical protein